MRCVLKTSADGVIGSVELHEGVELVDVVGAMREHRLFVVPEESVTLEAAPPKAGATLPGGQMRKGQRS